PPSGCACYSLAWNQDTQALTERLRPARPSRLRFPIGTRRARPLRGAVIDIAAVKHGPQHLNHLKEAVWVIHTDVLYAAETVALDVRAHTVVIPAAAMLSFAGSSRQVVAAVRNATQITAMVPHDPWKPTTLKEVLGNDMMALVWTLLAP